MPVVMYLEKFLRIVRVDTLKETRSFLLKLQAMTQAQIKQGMKMIRSSCQPKSGASTGSVLMDTAHSMQLTNTLFYQYKKQNKYTFLAVTVYVYEYYNGHCPLFDLYQT
jgi:hypothetical protein